MNFKNKLMINQENLKKELEIILEKDEELIWSDFPKQGFQLVFDDLIIIPFVSIVFSVAIFLFFNSLNYKSNKYLFILPVFMIIGIILLINQRYIEQINIHKKTIYGLTSKRAIILYQKKIKSIDITDIKEISFVEHPFNFIYGSVIFGEPESILGSCNEPFEYKYLLGYRGGINIKRDDFSFDFILNSKSIFNLIQSNINNAK
jgi:hypothetical protein